MVLCALGSRARERVFRHSQLANVRDVELLPAVGCAALTVAAQLKHEQPQDALWLARLQRVRRVRMTFR